MIKNLQSISHCSKGILIDKSILKLMNNPKSFKFEFDGTKIILIPIKIEKKDKNNETNY